MFGPDHEAFRAREVREGLDRGGVVKWHDERQFVARELPVPGQKARALQGLEVTAVRRGEDIRPGPLFDLEPEHLAAREHEADVRVRVRGLEGRLHLPKGVRER